MAVTHPPAAIVDDGAQLGDGSRSGTSRMSAPARASASGCSLGQGVFVGNDVRHRRQRQDPEQRLGLRRGDAGGRRVLRPEHGVHQRLQPARGGGAQERVPAHAGAARRHAGRQLHGRLRHHDRRATPSSAPARWSAATCRTSRWCVGVPARRIGWMSRHGERLALPPAASGEAACPATGERYRLRRRLQLAAEGVDLNRRAGVHRPEGPVRGAEDRDRRSACSACSTTASTSWAPRSPSWRRRSPPSPARGTASPWPAAPRRC